MKKGQGAFEYLLLIGGVLFLTVAVIVILRTGVLASGQQALGNATQQFNETVGCLVYCMSGTEKICAGKCKSDNTAYCEAGTLVVCTTGCINGTGCT